MIIEKELRAENARRVWIAGVICLVVLGGISVPRAVAAGPGPVEQLILQAGNADDDAIRLEILERLQETPGLDAKLRADVDKMVAAVRQWITSKQLPYFGGQVSRTRNFDFRLADDSPLYPLTCLYRARMLTWVTLESGGIIRNDQRRRQFLDEAVANFKIAGEAFPQNRIVQMYLGRPIPWRKQYAPVADAPKWAALQRENLERLTDVIHWWIDHRMQEDSQYGGGWGDDCEMWRWWVPVLIAFDDPKITAAQARFSNALMSQPHMTAGYTSRMSDVEHTAEDSADAITPMMHLDADNPLWKKRALRLAELMEQRWIGTNDRGRLQFKSTYFTVEKIDESPRRACDTVYHARTVQPALLYWQRTGDKRLEALFTAWMDTWVEATARAERGKPAGVIPSAIHWPDGAIGGLGEDWWDPRNHGEATLYEWPSAAGMMCDTLLLCWHMTGRPKYLQPLRSMATIRLRWLKASSRQSPEPGTEAWCAEKLGFLSRTLAKYRLLSGSREFDELLASDHRASMISSSGSGPSALVAALQDSAEALRVNFEGYTSEVRYTDRVLRFPALFGSDMMFAEAIRSIKTPDPSLLYSAATGDPGDCGYLPLAAVRWLTPPRDIAALVTAAGRDRFSAELFHFGEEQRSMSAEFYLLSPGRYSFLLRQVGGSPTDTVRAFSVDGSTTRLSFTLPARKLCVLRVIPASSE
jgi:hypothetical protein